MGECGRVGDCGRCGRHGRVREIVGDPGPRAGAGRRDGAAGRPARAGRWTRRSRGASCTRSCRPPRKGRGEVAERSRRGVGARSRRGGGAGSPSVPAQSRVNLGSISGTSRVHLGYISGTSRVHLGSHLGQISPRRRWRPAAWTAPSARPTVPRRVREGSEKGPRRVGAEGRSFGRRSRPSRRRLISPPISPDLARSPPISPPSRRRRASARRGRSRRGGDTALRWRTCSRTGPGRLLPYLQSTESSVCGSAGHRPGSPKSGVTETVTSSAPDLG